MFIARVLVLFLVLSAVACVPSKHGGQKRSYDVTRMLVGPPKVIIDDSFSVKAGSALMRGIELKRNTKVNIRVKGIKDFSKGFQVYVMPLNEWDNYKSKSTFRHFEQLRGIDVIDYNKTYVIKRGSIAIVVVNNNNIINNVLARLVVTVNPE